MSAPSAPAPTPTCARAGSEAGGGGGYHSDFKRGRRFKKLIKLLTSARAKADLTRYRTHTLMLLGLLLVVGWKPHWHTPLCAWAWACRVRGVVVCLRTAAPASPGVQRKERKKDLRPCKQEPPKASKGSRCMCAVRPLHACGTPCLAMAKPGPKYSPDAVPVCLCDCVPVYV
jgi:hypothetical protein